MKERDKARTWGTPQTQILVEWLEGHPATRQQWREIACSEEAAAWEDELVRQGDREVRDLVGVRLDVEATSESPTEVGSLHHDLLMQALCQVCWREVADYLLDAPETAGSSGERFAPTAFAG